MTTKSNNKIDNEYETAMKVHRQDEVMTILDNPILAMMRKPLLKV
jgi:hypothetical protein